MFGESKEAKASLSRLKGIARPLYFVTRGIMIIFAVGWSLFFFAFFVSLVTSDFDSSNLAGCFLCAISVAVFASVNVYILYVIGNVFNHMRKGITPFTVHVSRQIKIVSFLLLASFFLGAFVSALPLGDYTLGIVKIGLSKQGDGVVANLSISTLVASMVGFVLSYVFKYGALLQQLSDDTV